jgi:hypothetical protein
LAANFADRKSIIDIIYIIDCLRDTEELLSIYLMKSTNPIGFLNT